MKQFIFGVVLGLTLGLLGTAVAARVVGFDGYLPGWAVTIQGDTLCTNPYVWNVTRHIECAPGTEARSPLDRVPPRQDPA